MLCDPQGVHASSVSLLVTCAVSGAGRAHIWWLGSAAPGAGVASGPLIDVCFLLLSIVVI